MRRPGSARRREARPPGWPALLLAAGLLTAIPAADDDLARRTLANAEQLMREGKIEQALRDFEQVATAYADSSVADDALYRMGAHYYPNESVEGLGGAAGESILKARDLLRRIGTRYPKGDQAPGALYKLGLIALEPANPQRNIDEAYASFSGVVNIYPASELVDRALLGAGFADMAAGRYDKAIGSFERIAEEHARGQMAAEAHYQAGLAHARAGSWLRALEELQAVRDLAPKDPLAARALDRLTQIHKLKIRPGPGTLHLFAHDASYAPAVDPNIVRGEATVAVDADSVLHLLDARSGAVLRLGHDGKLKSTGTPLSSAISLSVDAAGAELVAAGSRFRDGVEIVIPQRQEGSALRPMSGITAVARAGAREVALLDESSNEVLLYSGDPARLGVLYRDAGGRARLTGLAAGGEGKLYTIDRRSRRIIEIPLKGAPREIAPAGDPIQEPVAIAADDLGTLAVMDRRSRSLFVLSTEGKVLDRLTAQPSTPADFTYATSIALGPRGELYVFDAKRKTILRFW